jgi:hypothetical protein
MDVLDGSCSYKVAEMPNLDTKDHFGDKNREPHSTDEDLLMEQILENINNTPIGQVLKKIASLPEIRKEKILEIRRRLTEGNYNLNGRLNIVLDKVLEDLTA